MKAEMKTTCPLRFIDVCKYFPFGAMQKKALNDINLSLKPGCITGLVGPDGAGKSTLMRLAARLLLPSAGKILVYGTDRINDDTDIGYMPQHFGLYEDLTVSENFDLFADLQGLNSAENIARQHELLKLTNLAPFANRRAGALSGGMKQKLGLACALLRTPHLLLLDEPTVGVDPISRRELWNIIQTIKNDGGTILISTAYFDEAEKCDEIILLHEGHLLKQQTLEAFRNPLENHTFLVTAPNMTRRHLQDSMRMRSEILDARIIANGIRVITKNTIPQREPTEIWKNVTPSFEDAFVSLLGKASGSNVQHVEISDAKKASTEQVIIEVKNLSRFFGSFQAVKNISFAVKKGEIFGLLGANGAGKTTTFRMLCGLLPPSSGTLSVANVDMRNAPAAARARIGYVSQKFALYGNLSINENLQFFSAAYGLRGKKRQEQIAWITNKFQLNEYNNINVDSLPLGIKQRLALACALVHNPDILFLDEPTSGVDPLARREFWERVNKLAIHGVTVLITTHFMDEAEYCDNLVLMSAGKILAHGSPNEIREKARDANDPEPTMEDAFIRLIQQHEGQSRETS